MVHWVYILRCTGEDCENTSKGHNDKIYVGETTRLFRRLKEHTVRRVGSCTTSEFYPNRLIGLYRTSNDYLLLDGDTITHDMYKTGYLDEDKNDTRTLENTITEMYMQAMGPKWKSVYGGKYHNGYRPLDNPGEKEFNRPFCNCKIPADIMKYNDKVYWRCSRKNIWDELYEYIVDELDLGFQRAVVPCKFYKEYKEGEKFKCDNLIYNYPLIMVKKKQQFKDLIKKSQWLKNIPCEEDGVAGQCIKCNCYVWCNAKGHWNPNGIFYPVFKDLGFNRRLLCKKCFINYNNELSKKYTMGDLDKEREIVFKFTGKCLIMDDSDDELSKSNDNL